MPPDNKPDLSVTELKAYALREPVSRRAYTILEARTRGGLTGYGECSAATPEALAQARQSTTGQPATSYEVISRQLSAYPAMQAAVVMALLDITGKYAKSPLYQTLGGPTRNKARAITPLSGATDAELAAQMKRARDAGHRAFLVPAPAPAAANQGQAFVKATRARLASLPNFFIHQVPFTESSEDRAVRASRGGASLETPVDGFLSLPSGPGLGIT